MRIDLQVHSFPASADSKITAHELAPACERVGLDGLALTEHGPPEPQEAVESMTSEGLLCITAREVSCAGAHLLLICADVQMLRSIDRVVEPDNTELHRDDVAVVWAHPAAPSGSSAYAPVSADPNRLRGVVHAVEVLNGRHLHFPEAVMRAEAICEELGLPATGGSDAHKADDIGRCFTSIDAIASDGVDGVVRAIRQGRTQPVLSKVWMGFQDYDYRQDLERFLA